MKTAPRKPTCGKHYCRHCCGCGVCRWADSKGEPCKPPQPESRP